jgi:hypothetical protein
MATGLVILGDTVVYNRALTPEQIYTHWISSTYGAKMTFQRAIWNPE